MLQNDMDSEQPRKLSEKDRYIVPAVEQAIQVLECLAESDTPQLSLLKICSNVGIHKSKAYSILHTLKKYDLVRKIENKGGYSLGPRLVSLSKRFLDNLDARTLAKPILEKLAKEHSCAAVFGVVEDDYVFVAEKAEAEHTFSIVASSVGQRFPIDMGSHGVAIASVLSDAEIEKILSNSDAKPHGDFKRFNDDEFQRQLKYCRANGYAYDIGHIRPGLNSVCSPVFSTRKSVYGYIIVFGLFSEKEIDKIGQKTVAGAKTLSKQLG